MIRRRPDGYHDLLSLICPVALYDTLSVTFGSGSGIQVVCDHPDIPENAANLAAQAAALFLETAFPGAPPPNSSIRIRIDKQIPVGAGLGGGSSNAATMLMVLNRYYGSPLSVSELMHLGKKIGADVPFFIFGKSALVTGIGDRLKSFPHLPSRTLLLIYPGVSVSTAWVYKNLKIQLTKGQKKLSKSNFKSPFFRLEEHIANDLESVTEVAFPVIQTLKRLLLANGATGALMSGSGSTVFGIFSDSDKARSACWALYDHPESHNWAFYVADLLV